MSVPLFKAAAAAAFFVLALTAANAQTPAATETPAPEQAPAVLAAPPAAEATNAAGDADSATSPVGVDVPDEAAPTQSDVTEALTPAPAQTPPTQDRAKLVTRSGVHEFSVEIADDPIERAEGLMFREEMARDHGMLFDFAIPGPRSFWMKNTPLSLDIIFIEEDGTVESIARATTPYSTDPIPSEGAVRFVLEVNAGVADEIALQPGDTLLHQRIGAAP